MDTQSTKIQLLTRKVKSPNFIYSSIFFLFIAIVVVLFFLSTNFIVTNINKIFSPTDSGTTQALDLNGYELVAKRLGFSFSTTTSSTLLTSKEAASQNTAISTPLKTSLSIRILNSTTVVGSASALSKQLEAAGFSKANTGNQKKIASTTTIQLKDSAKFYAETLRNIVKNTYPNTSIIDAPAGTTSDVTIVIGKQ